MLFVAPKQAVIQSTSFLPRTPNGTIYMPISTLVYLKKEVVCEQYILRRGIKTASDNQEACICFTAADMAC